MAVAMTDEQEVRAKALECAVALIARRQDAAPAKFWPVVSDFEIYITTGVQPNGEKAT